MLESKCAHGLFCLKLCPLQLLYLTFVLKIINIKVMIEKPKVAHFFLDLLVISSELVVNLKICQYESCRAGNLAQKRHFTLSSSSIINKQNEFENIISLFAFVVVAILLSKHALVRSYSSQCETAALALCGRGQRRTLRAQFSHVLRLRRSRFFLLRALAPQNFPSVH